MPFFIRSKLFEAWLELTSGNFHQYKRYGIGSIVLNQSLTFTMLRATDPGVLQTVAFGKWYVTIFNNIWVSLLVAY